MKHFWVLPPLLRVAVAAHQSFSVHNDLLAYPQFEIIYSDSFIGDAEADKCLDFELRRGIHDAASEPSISEIAKHLEAAQSRLREDDGPIEHPHPDYTYERLILRDRPYLCTIPPVTPETPKNTTSTAEDATQDLQRASDHGVELLKGMQGQCIYYISGWWAYSFCYNDGVKQFHHMPQRNGIPFYPPIEDETVPSYVLGRFIDSGAKKQSTDSSSPPTADGTSSLPAPNTQLQTRGETNYLLQKLDSGDQCDLTGHDRRVEVQFHCNPGSPDRIALIKETASCVYLMVIHTPRLCGDVAFRPPQAETPLSVTCQEILSEGQVQRWKDDKTKEAQSIFFNGRPAAEDADAKRVKKLPVVGGVEVGGRNLVGGSAEQKIKPGNIVAGNGPSLGGAEKFVARIASSDGKRVSHLSAAELKRLGLKAEEGDMEEWVEKSERRAGEGKPWKLRVMDTPRGREFQLIVGTDKDEEDSFEQAWKKGEKNHDPEPADNGSAGGDAKDTVPEAAEEQERQTEKGDGEPMAKGSEEELWKDRDEL